MTIIHFPKDKFILVTKILGLRHSRKIYILIRKILMLTMIKVIQNVPKPLSFQEKSPTKMTIYWTKAMTPTNLMPY